MKNNINIIKNKYLILLNYFKKIKLNIYRNDRDRDREHNNEYLLYIY